MQAGQYHTFEVGLSNRFKLEKGEWSSEAQELLQTATDPSKRADVVALLLDQSGRAEIFLVTPTTTTRRALIDCTVNKNKRFANTSQAEKQMASFFDTVACSLTNNLNLDGMLMSYSIDY